MKKMNKLKILIIITVSFILTGCNSQINLTYINENNISIQSKTSENLKKIKKMFYNEYDYFDSLFLYAQLPKLDNKIYKDDTFAYLDLNNDKISLDELLNKKNSIYGIEIKEYKKEKDNIKISLNMYTRSENDNVTFKIKSNHIMSTNADKQNSLLGTYTWNLNKEDKDIEIIISNKINPIAYLNNTPYGLTLVILSIFALLGLITLIIYITNIIKNKDKVNSI